MTDNLNSIFKNYINNKKASKQSICKDCNVAFVPDHDKGFYYCEECGISGDMIIDSKAEWSVYDNNTDKCNIRCGAPFDKFFPVKSMTIFTKKKYPRDFSNSIPYEETSLDSAFKILTMCCNKANLSNAVLETAKILYHEIRKARHTSGKKKGKKVIIRGKKNVYGRYAGCLYYSCILEDYYLTQSELEKIFEIPKTAITKGINTVKKDLRHFEVMEYLIPKYSRDFVERHCYKINMNENDIDKVMTIITNTKKIYLATNHKPIPIIAACVMLYCKINDIEVNKSNLVEVFCVTSNTLDKIYEKLYPFRHVITDDDITNMIYDSLIVNKEKVLDYDNNESNKKDIKEFKELLIKKYNENNSLKSKRGRKPKKSEDGDEVSICSQSDYSYISKYDNYADDEYMSDDSDFEELSDISEGEDSEED